MTAGRVAAALAALVFAVAVAPGAANAAVPPVRWCGTDSTGADRLPDTVGGHQIHVVYAFPSDASPRIGAASLVATIAAELDAWWRREDPVRTPRFDLFAPPACESRFGALDVSFAQLPAPAAAYLPLSREERIGRIVQTLTDPPFGLAHPGKKYLVLYDGPIPAGMLCGGGQNGYPLRGGVFGYSMAFVGAGSGSCELAGTGIRFVAAHEFLHSLDALPSPFPQPGPPHPCPGDLGHVCDDARDLLYGLARPYDLDISILDHGRDDYYAHAGPWWDVQDSPWLARLDLPSVPLTITTEGAEPGERIDADVPGISCPPACANSFQQGTQLTLTATTATGGVDRLVHWRGDCAGTDACTLTLDAPKSVTVVFRAVVQPLSLTIRGRGRVVSSPPYFSCSRSCSDVFDTDEAATLRAVAARGWRFVSWSGDCAGRRACRLFFDAPRSVTARFVRRR